MAALRAAGRSGELIELRTIIPNVNIASAHDGFVTAISENGYHCGVKVDDLVFDNLHPNGIPYAEWLGSFEAVGGLHPPTPTGF
jgi:hypothetical protein